MYKRGIRDERNSSVLDTRMQIIWDSEIKHTHGYMFFLMLPSQKRSMPQFDLDYRYNLLEIK